MENTKKLFGILLIVFISACATMHPDLIAEGEVEVVLNKSAYVNYSKVDVHKHNGTTQIEVVVRPVERERMFSVGSIKILVANPDGSQEILVSDRAHIDRHKIGSTLQHAHFTIFVPRVLQTGSKLNISYAPSEQN